MQASSSRTTEPSQLSLNKQDTPNTPTALPPVRIKARECDKDIAVIIPITGQQGTIFPAERLQLDDNGGYTAGIMSDGNPAMFVAVPRLRIAELYNLLKTIGASDDGIVQRLLQNSIKKGDENEPVSPRLGAAYNFYTQKYFLLRDEYQDADKQKAADKILQMAMLLRAKSDVLWKPNPTEKSNFGKDETAQYFIEHLQSVGETATFMYQNDTNFDVNKFLIDAILNANKITAETLLKTEIIKQKDKVLDVGAGYCEFGNTLKDKNINITSIEPAPELYKKPNSQLFSKILKL